MTSGSGMASKKSLIGPAIAWNKFCAQDPRHFHVRLATQICTHMPSSASTPPQSRSPKCARVRAPSLTASSIMVLSPAFIARLLSLLTLSPPQPHAHFSHLSSDDCITRINFTRRCGHQPKSITNFKRRRSPPPFPSPPIPQTRLRVVGNPVDTDRWGEAAQQLNGWAKIVLSSFCCPQIPHVFAAWACL